MIARVEKSFYGAEAMAQLVSDTEPFTDSFSRDSQAAVLFTTSVGSEGNTRFIWCLVVERT
jgi:hypothetical protein